MEQFFQVNMSTLCVIYLSHLSHYLSLTSPLYVHFTWPMPPGPYRATTCRGRELWITDILFWPHKDMESLPWWVIARCRGPPPRQHKPVRRYTLSTHPFILTRRIWNDDYGGQMIFGDLVGLKLSVICLTGEEKPHPGNLSRPGIEPGPAAWQERILSLAPQRWTDIFISQLNEYI